MKDKIEEILLRNASMHNAPGAYICENEFIFYDRDIVKAVEEIEALIQEETDDSIRYQDL